MEDQAEKLREIMRRKKDNKSVSASASSDSAGGSNSGGRQLSSSSSSSTQGSSSSGRFESVSNNPSASRQKKNDKARIITVTSGKGGVGKTNLSVNMALAFARLGKKVIVMDADLGLANVNVMLNMIPKFTLYHVIKKQKTIRDILVETEYGISIVAGASGFSQIANMGEEDRRDFISELETLTNADIIIIDTSAGVSSNVLDFIAAADDAVIITTPEPTAITDAYGIIKIIATEYDALNMGLKLVVNRSKSAAEAKGVADRMINIAGQFLNLKVDYLGFIYDDVAVQHAVLRQKPFMVVDPKCKASICVQHIVERMDRNKPIERNGFGDMIRRFFRSSSDTI